MANGNQLSKIHQRVLDKNRIALGEEPKVPENTFWDDAQDHYEKSMGAIAQVEGTLRDVLVGFISDKDKLNKIVDQVGLANNINILTKDISEHVGRLNSIHAKHSNHKGGTTTPDEHMELLQVHGEYAEALEIYQANIIPIVSSIMEQVGAVEELVISEQMAKDLLAKDAATDVSVVTDVQIKEPAESI